MTLEQINLWIVVLLGVGALAGGLWRAVRWLVKAVDRLDSRIEHHTSSNGGSSLYDHARQARAAAEQVAEKVDEVARDLADLRRHKDSAHDALWDAIRQVTDRVGDLTDSLSHLAAARPGGRRYYDPPNPS